MPKLKYMKVGSLHSSFMHSKLLTRTTSLDMILVQSPSETPQLKFRGLNTKNFTWSGTANKTAT